MITVKHFNYVRYVVIARDRSETRSDTEPIRKDLSANRPNSLVPCKKVYRLIRRLLSLLNRHTEYCGVVRLHVRRSKLIHVQLRK